jgi:Tol biopolymer transport system component
VRRGVLICVMAALLSPGAAQAAFPGHNGTIAFSDNRDDPNPTGCYPNCNAEIYSVNPDGTGVARLTNDPAYDSTPSWSPDGRQIVFARAPSANFSADVVVMNADGSGETVLDSGFDPSWSPDGSKIVYVGFDSRCDGDALITINPDGTGRSWLACASHSGPFAPAWSPDGGLIAYADPLPGLDIWTVKSDGTGAVNHHNSPEGDRETNPNWSPDATKIIYENDHGSAGGIWRMDRDGSNQTSLTADGEMNPAYSPDGTLIVFTGVRMMSANGGPATFVTGGRDPDWQPIPVNSYPRPKGASPMRVSLVTAYGQCTSPNRTHGPPLAFGSCNPPAKESQHVTVGTGDSNMRPARNEGFLRLRAMPGNPGTPADEADVAISFFSDDIFNLDLTDYTGELRASVPITITDKDNTPHPGGPGAGTTQQFDFTVDATCVAVADPQEGSSCQTSTTADALIPGAIKEGRRAVWQLGQVVVYDGGADGDTATTGNTVFARQGVFVP